MPPVGVVHSEGDGGRDGDGDYPGKTEHDVGALGGLVGGVAYRLSDGKEPGVSETK